jgi:hypothetical protein
MIPAMSQTLLCKPTGAKPAAPVSVFATHKARVPAEFIGKARRLIDAIGKEDEIWAPAFQDIIQSLGCRDRYRKSSTARFIQQIRRLPSLGTLDIEERHTKRSGSTITIGRLAAERHRLRGWDDDAEEQALMVCLQSIIIRPDNIGYRVLEPVAVSMHAVARCFQRMPQANDATVVAAIGPLIPFWIHYSEELGRPFALNGWRGRVRLRGDVEDYENDRVMCVRTYLETGDEEE